jgi:preprotein translocase subunit SecY
VYGGQTSYIPFAINYSALTPLSWLLAAIAGLNAGALLFRDTASGWVRVLASLEYQLTDPRDVAFWLLFAVLGVLFGIAFVPAAYDVAGIANTLQRNGGVIPGVRPGKRTEEYLSMIALRIGGVGVLLTTALLVVPGLLAAAFGLLSSRQVAIWPLLLIAVVYTVGLITDFARSVEARLVMSQYEGFGYR